MDRPAKGDINERHTIVWAGKDQPHAKEPWLIYSWEDIPPRIRGGFLNKIYGFRSGKNKYEGLIKRCGGIKIGKSAAAISKAESAGFEELLSKHHIPYTVREFYR